MTAPLTTTENLACSCGETKAHTIGRRLTADGKSVLLWSDGSLTWALGYAIKGSAFPRTADQRRRALVAGWLVIGEVCLRNADEVSDLVKAARWVAERSGLPGDVRKRFHAMHAPKGMVPTWTVLAADRDGKPTTRVWKLPRLGGWARLAVWHERGVYEVMREERRAGVGVRTAPVLVPTGFRASTLRGIQDLLPQLREVEL